MFAWRSYRHTLWLNSANWVARKPALSRWVWQQFSQNAAGLSAEELQAARSWLGRLSPRTVPRDICEVSFSRSSGPGGQNVNKLNTKVTLRVPLAALLPLIPSALHSEIRASRFFASRSESLVIHSDETRKQSRNLELCFEKLCGVLSEAGKAAVPGETSAEQRKRVKELQNRANDTRIRTKKAHSSKKSNRRNKGYDD